MVTNEIAALADEEEADGRLTLDLLTLETEGVIWTELKELADDKPPTTEVLLTDEIPETILDAGGTTMLLLEGCRLADEAATLTLNADELLGMLEELLTGKDELLATPGAALLATGGEETEDSPTDTEEEGPTETDEDGPATENELLEANDDTDTADEAADAAAELLTAIDETEPADDDAAADAAAAWLEDDRNDDAETDDNAAAAGPTIHLIGSPRRKKSNFCVVCLPVKTTGASPRNQKSKLFVF
jgi:hypothetical protein